MIYLGLGVVVLILVLGLSRVFVAADPAALARRLGRFVGAIQRRRQAARDRPPRRSSEVETEYIRMRLDHDSGTMSGMVRRGPFQGRRLDELTRAAGTGGGKAGPRTADTMTRAEAYEVLGLSWGAGESEIREAHRRLMLKLHPDHGGSTYLAAKLNRAREVLLAG